MSRSAANVISIVFHPLFLATYLFALVIFIDPMIALPPGYNKLAQWLIVLVVWITTFVIPALSIVMLKFTGTIRSLHLKDRRERLVPFFYITVFYGFTAYYFSSQMIVSRLTEGIFILTAVSIFIGAVITIFWKISIHGLGIGGVVGILLVLAVSIPESSIGYALFASFLVAGLVISARLRLNAHTPAQVYAGFVLGLFISFVLILWF